MSKKHRAWAFKQKIPIPGAKLVLHALADCTNSATGSTFAGQKYLAGQTGQGERTVRRHLAWLEEHGYIRRQSRWRQRGGRSSDMIYINLDRPEGRPVETLSQSETRFVPEAVPAIAAEALAETPSEAAAAAHTGQNGRYGHTGQNGRAIPAKMAGDTNLSSLTKKIPIPGKEDSLRVELRVLEGGLSPGPEKSAECENQEVPHAAAG